MGALFGGGNGDARRAQEANNRRQLAELARQKGEAEQATATGGKRRAGALLNFANPDALLSGTGKSTFG